MGHVSQLRARRAQQVRRVHTLGMLTAWVSSLASSPAPLHAANGGRRASAAHGKSKRRRAGPGRGLLASNRRR